MLGASAACAVELDPKIIGFKLPDQIQWTENTRGGNRAAVLQGDPSKPGPYAMLLTWLPGNMSRPHFHPNDRFFMVLSGTWWVGNGGKFDPEATAPMPAGTHVIHWAKGVHYDGAKNEPATILGDLNVGLDHKGVAGAEFKSLLDAGWARAHEDEPTFYGNKGAKDR